MEILRDQHKEEVVSFLQKHVSNQRWEIGLPPHGTGNETYFVQGDGRSCFVKLGAKTERYRVMSEMGLSPQVIATGQLEDGTSILVQQRIAGDKPSRADFHRYLRKFAESIRKTHQSEILQGILPAQPSSLYQDVGLEMLGEIEGRWRKFEPLVAAALRDYVNRKIAYLKEQISQFAGGGLAASHNDICNGNWLVATDGRLYLLDYEAMSLDDPALDLGAILWWYYPPEMRDEFLTIAGCPNDERFRERMRIRMAVHNLHIILPREKSFDRFNAETFADALVDFRAVVEGRENPQGYYD
jgi:thiamine kinase-like enzyme